VGAPRVATPRQKVVVYRDGDRSVGLLVDQIIDIVDDRVERSDISDDGVVASALVRGHVTEILDVTAAVLAADPAFFDVTATEDAGARS
jgi:two-component system chemotaxis sensor kinase CheA